MAPNNTNSGETPVSEGSESYKAGAARRDGKRGQTSSTNNLVRKKVHQDEEPDLPLFNRGSGGAQRLSEGREVLGSLSSNVPTYGAHHWSAGRGVARQSADCNAQHLSAGSLGEQGHEHLPAGSVSVRHEHLPAGSVSANRLPAGRQNDGNLSADSVSMMTPLPSNVWGENEIDEFPDSDLDGLLEADIEKLVGPALSRAPVVEDDGPEARANEVDEFSDLDVEDLTEVDFQQLESQPLGHAPVADEDDGQKAGENVVEKFLNSDLGSLSETDIQRLLDQAVPKSAKALDGGDSEAPVMGVGESNLGVESIDTDSLIMDKDRIDMYVEDVEEGGLEFLLDEIFTQQGNPTAAAFARDETEWSSARSPFTFHAWSWFRNAEAGRLTDIVFNFVFPAVRQILSADSLDMVLLLSLPEPRLDDLVDSCNNPGVYVFVCHARRGVHPQSGSREAIDNNTVASYAGQSIAKPREDGYQGMSLRFDQHRREMRRSIPELEDNAQRVSATVPRLYRTVVENKLEVNPRVVATLPRDGHMADRAMLIETVIIYPETAPFSGAVHTSAYGIEQSSACSSGLQIQRPGLSTVQLVRA
ncbi:uncharacterized protein FTJAE_1441 [Fusarium tjaetaba]|uniref:Uncharacterized protein n=1 Tax=Fusarium tjaetaba TaxID=1567544 RepID=A0A8H5W412_9HYPO|nr:uncharacterized protein FTJAE_1441 [Fusarium tjaetaba]KAF5648227.1 hypothetical protein FTJAE_1441 [Fusarium tjaetaba]